jgi:hypothetical protein
VIMLRKLGVYIILQSSCSLKPETWYQTTRSTILVIRIWKRPISS